MATAGSNAVPAAAVARACYNPELVEAICEEIATTDPQARERICRREGMLDARTVYRWLDARKSSEPR